MVLQDYKITRLQDYNVFFLVDDPSYIKIQKKIGKFLSNTLTRTTFTKTKKLHHIHIGPPIKQD